MNFRFDTISFFIGMATATLVWWLVTLLRPLLEQWLKSIQNIQSKLAKNNTSEIEINYRNALHRQVQGMHLAGSLFALDEIVETPRLLAPPIVFEPHSPNQKQDIVEETLPYLPYYPELGAFYKAPSLTLPQALSGGVNLAIIGQPGAGKTTALAYLASQIAISASDDPALGKYIPFYVHVADLGLPLHNPQKSDDYLAPIIDKISKFMRVFDATRIPKFVANSFANGQALLLLDGVDELAQSSLRDINTYLLTLMQKFPNCRIVMTGSPEYLDSIQYLGFTALSILPWSAEQQTHFLNNWSSLWQKNIPTETSVKNGLSSIDSTLLNRWVSTDNFTLTPLEYTLKIWGAYAGDTRSAHPADNIEAHIRRLTPSGIPDDALTILGVQTSTNGISLFDGRQAVEWTKSFEPIDSAEISSEESADLSNNSTFISEADASTAEIKNVRKRKSAETHQLAKPSMISSLVNSKLLTAHNGNKLRFAHPVFMGFLAAKGFGTMQVDSGAILKQPAWAGQTICLDYMAAFGDVAGVVKELMVKEDPILFRPKLKAARLIRNSRQSRESAWLGDVIASLVQILQDEDNPIGLRGEAMAALALCGDSNTNQLFRQLLLAPSNVVRQLAALGSGFLRDAKTVDTLVDLTTNTQEATRRASCLALVEIGTASALEAVAINLLRGDERLRIFSAEALANHPSDGQDALREGFDSDDILVRRAIIYGLSRINETWSTQLLEKAQVQDEQWAVRNIAVEFLNARQKPDPRIPTRLTAPHETPWLIELAGKYGMGIPPGQPATDVMLLALKDSNRDFFQPALNYLRSAPTEGVLAALYPHLYGIDPEAKEAVFQTLSYMAFTGTLLPNPRQFGLG
ncbi:MAG: HEAT repeat domain-containing protein [Chloroflexi bacterium]|nr:HEAT repeat domain-containing protein [Chloroflexota bacterium]